jgi:ABC-type antimicrobial peptide transport system permease subunit
MNIMLISVTERTREIGIRKAVGARRRDILVQFLTEALVISIIGGLFGIAFGWLISFVVSALAGWPSIITTLSIVVAVLFSAVTGTIFGLWPARQASLLNPIDALRYE